MKCRLCDSDLPDRALFCGECGRAVVSASPPSNSAAHPIVARPLTVAAPPPEPGAAISTGVIRTVVDACEQCGSALAPTDIFCGECGFVARGIGFGADPSAGRVGTQGRIETPDQTSDSFEVEPTPEVEPDTVPDRDAADAADDDVAEDADADADAARFILQFSTGDSVTVSRSGLIGRNPTPEPGEFFDELVKINDSTRSVSKTHLEFGHEGGEFWIKDRYSGNGTVLRGPDAPVVQLVADRRYRVPRGSRVDLGEQFFVVS